MEIIREASAGAAEGGDVLVSVAPCNDGVKVEIASVVKELFGQAIEEAVRGEAARHGVTNCRIRIDDKGALDYAIRARVETALYRAAKGVGA